jgi:hypothetical protein
MRIATLAITAIERASAPQLTSASNEVAKQKTK